VASDPGNDEGQAEMRQLLGLIEFIHPSVQKVTVTCANSQSGYRRPRRCW
jgi:hypothetical protein